MKKTFTKILLVLLALSLMLCTASLLASCTGEGGEKKEEEEKEEKTDVLAKLPSVTYNNDEFVIMCRDEGAEFLRDDSGTDRIDYEIYMRNRKIEDKYKVKLVAKNYEYYNIPDMVGTMIKSNDQNSLDLISNHIVYSSNIATAGNALDWQEVPYVDLTAEWWAKSNLEDLTLNEQTYIIIGDMQTAAIGLTYCMYYNKELADTYDVGDLYDVAMNKEWTYNKMLETIAKVGRVDLNKDGKYNSKDLYGLLTGGGSFVNAYLWAFDNPIFSRDDNGDLEFSMMTKKLPTIMKNLVSLYHKNDGVNTVGSLSEMFVNGQGLLWNGLFSSAMSVLRDMNTDDWGIIPYPMWNAAQAKTVGYQTSVDGGHNALMAPFFRGAGEAKAEQIGIITEAITALSHSGLRVAYYDTALKSQYVGDPKEAKMIDMLMDCRVFDFGYIYLAFSSPAFWLQEMIPSRNDNISSKYQGAKSGLNNVISNGYTAFGLEFEGLE